MTLEDLYTRPFFWATLSMLGMAMATSLFSKHKYRRSRLLVSAALVFVTVGRICLALPFCEQPRFDMGGWHWITGGTILALAFAVTIQPVFVVRWWEPPKEGMKLITTGIYGLVRNPIYLFEVLWPVGLSIMFRSTYGLMLTPAWWLVFWIHTLSEEAELERTLGESYVEYMKKVRGRIFPYLPI